MKSKAWLWLIGLALLLSGVAHAEGNCPDGMYETNPPGTEGPVGCAPIPGYNQQQGQQQTPQPPPEQWADHWGAIATDGLSGSFGASTNLLTRSSAEQAALTDCQSKKGSQNCKIETWYRNGCAAMVLSDKGHNVTNGATADEAIRAGMKICSAAKDGRCDVYYSACSLPQRVQ